MTELRPWTGFDSLVDGLARLQARAREGAIGSATDPGVRWLAVAFGARQMG